MNYEVNAEGIFRFYYAVAVVCVAQPRAMGQDADGTVVQTAAEQLLAFANQSRAENGADKLRWDPALTAAALKALQTHGG